MSRRRFWSAFAIVALLAVAAVYGYYKLSSTGYKIGLAKRGRILTGSGQPVANAWVIAKWIGYLRGVHGAPRPIVYAGVAVRTDASGTYTLPAEWRSLQRPLNQIPFNTGYYAFGLLVFAPGQELDAEKSPPCSKIGHEPPPFLCPETTKATIDGSIGDQITDVWLKQADTTLADRARAFRMWNAVAFTNTQAAPDLGWHGPARNAIAASQQKELADLACAISGELPYQVFEDAASTVADQDAAVRFITNVLGADKVSPYGTDLSCHDVAARCPPVAAEKVCSALREIAPATSATAQESTP